MKPKSARFTAILTASALAALPSTLFAAPISWTGASGGDYEADANWDTGTAPANDLVTDIAILTGGSVDLTTTRQVNGLSSTAIASLTDTLGTGSLEIGSGGITTGDFTNIYADLIFNTNTIIDVTGGVLSLRGSSTLSGSADLVFSGANSIFIDNASNTLSGTTTIHNGATVEIKGSNGIGSGLVTLDNGTLKSNNASFSLIQAVVVNSGGGTINTDGAINGQLSGTGALTIIGQGAERSIQDGNTNSGGITLDNTYFRTNGNSSYGTGSITLKNGAIVKNSNNNLNFSNDIVLDSTNTSGGQFEVGWEKTITLSGVVSGDGSLTIRPDSGILQLGSNNTYTGETIIRGNVTGNGSAFGVDGDITFDGGSLVATHNFGFGTRAVSFDGDAAIRVYNGRSVTMEGVVDGVGMLTVGNDGGSVRLFNGANSYSGGTYIIGRVNAKSGGLGTGDVTLDDQQGSRGWLQNQNGAATYENNFIISDANNGGRLKAGWGSDMTISGVVSGAGTLTIEGDSGTVVLANTGNTFSGDINLQDSNSRLKVASLGGGSYAGVISGPGTFEYVGSGSQTLTGTSTSTAPTMVSSGTLVINGNISTSSLTTVSAGASIAGDGVTGALTIEAGGSHNPGNSPGIMTVAGDYTMAGTLNAEITGTTAGVGGYDQVQVTGTVDITGGDLITLFSGAPGTYAENDLILILSNDGFDAVVGTFNGFAEGAVVDTYDGLNWKISYVTGDGNDIGLQAVVIPEPSTMLLGGLGLLALLRRRRN